MLPIINTPIRLIMKTAHEQPTAYADFEIGINEIPVEELFKKYEEVGFLNASRKNWVLSPTNWAGVLIS